MDSCNGTGCTRFQPAGTQSSLYRKLCAADSLGRCTFPPLVTLDQTLQCNGIECEVDTATTVRLMDGAQAVFYRYVPPACAELAFHDGLVISTIGQRQTLCADPSIAAAGATCCNLNNNASTGQCKYLGENVAYSTMQSRCAGRRICSSVASVSGQCGYSRGGVYSWTNVPCSVQAQVNPQGLVNIVHASPNAAAHFAVGSTNNFRVSWSGGRFPVPPSCASLCEIRGNTCLCNVALRLAAVFSSAPSLPEVLSLLPIGSFAPELLGYRLCSSAECTSQAGVKVYTPSGAASFDTTTVFSVMVDGAPVFRANKVSTVRVGDNSFRNPSTLLKLSTPQTEWDVEYEVVRALRFSAITHQSDAIHVLCCVLVHLSCNVHHGVAGESPRSPVQARQHRSVHSETAYPALRDLEPVASLCASGSTSV